MNQEFHQAVTRVLQLDDERKQAREEAFQALAFSDPDMANLALTVFDDNREKAAAWFASRPPVFGGRMPLEICIDNRDWVSQVLYQIEHGLLA